MDTPPWAGTLVEAPKARTSTIWNTVFSARYYPLTDQAASIIPPPSLILYRRTYRWRSQGFCTGEASDSPLPPGNASLQPEPRHGFFHHHGFCFTTGCRPRRRPGLYREAGPGEGAQPFVRPQGIAEGLRRLGGGESRFWPSTSRPGAWKAHGTAGRTSSSVKAESRLAELFQAAFTDEEVLPTAGLKQPSSRATTSWRRG
jgi:hypothetical protein